MRGIPRRSAGTHRNLRHRAICPAYHEPKRTRAFILAAHDFSILDLIDGERSVQDIVAAMIADYDADLDVIVRDVQTYILELVEAGVICEKSPS